jgi:PmbA protein
MAPFSEYATNMNFHQLDDLLRERALGALALAQELGAEQSEIGLSADEGSSVTVRLGKLESVERQKNRSLGITVYRNHCKGSVSSTDFSMEGIESAVRKALSIATFTAEDPHSGLADADLMAKDIKDLDLFHPWDIDVDSAERVALRCEEAARAYDVRIDNSEGATLATNGGIRIYANSQGFIGGYPSTSHSLSCSVVARRDDELERDYWVSSARVPGELEHATAVGRRAAERAVRRLGSRQLATRVAAVLYPPELARGLIAHLVSAISGTSQYRRASFLLDACGKQFAASDLDIDEDPHIPRAMGSTCFDSDGVATAPRRLVDKGVLRGYALSAYSGRRLGLPTTGNAGGIHNLLVRPTAGPMEDILADCEGVFVVSELLGQGVSVVTGDYSRGAAGHWVERGEVVHPVSEVTIAGNLSEMYRKIAAVGNDVDRRGVIRCGSLLVEGMTVAGQ